MPTRRVLVAMASLAATTAACGGGSDSGRTDVESLRAASATLIEVDGSPVLRGLVASDGRSIAILDDGRLCVVGIESESDSSGCARLESSISWEQASWSADSSGVLFNENYIQVRDEPDIRRFDVEAGEIQLLTDDGEDGDAGFVDISPFQSESGDVYFFRQQAGESDFELYRIASDVLDGADADDATQVGDVDLPVDIVPIYAARPFSDDRWAVLGATFDFRFTTELFVVDVAEESVDGYEVASARRPSRIVLTDVSSTAALVSDLVPLERMDFERGDDVLSLVDFESGDVEGIELDLEAESLPVAAGFSPDGTTIAIVAVTLGSDEPPSLLFVPVEEGEPGDQVELELPAELDGVNLTGIGPSGEIGWTDDDRLVLGGGDQIVVIDLGEES